MAHLSVTSCLLTRGLAGLELGLPDEFVADNRKGTSPKNWADAPSWQSVRESLLTTAAGIREDFAENRHADFTSYPTSFGYTESAASALLFNNLHEGIHLGVILAYRHNI